ncbi:MAG TPA: ABC transporter ATP-binding protein [Anaerolineales bacterium]
MAAIQTIALSRVYHSKTGVIRQQKKDIRALEEVNLEVAQGELFGLLGPNGAGKTTLTKILSTILLPSSGDARVLGLDIVSQARAIRPRIGIVFGGERGLYWRLSARDTLLYFADLYHVSPEVAARRIPELLELVGLSGRHEERVENFSRGMKQRLHVARGLINDPEILFLDEPTIGLDPVAAREIRRIMKDLNQQGKTIFLTSHYMYEVDELCDRVAVLNKGEIILVDTPGALKSLVSDLEVVEIEVIGAQQDAIERLRAHEKVVSLQIEPRDLAQALLIQAPGGAALVGDFLTILSGARIQRILTRQPTLEDAYVRLVGPEAMHT